jgi:hypothetical protein
LNNPGTAGDGEIIVGPTYTPSPDLRLKANAPQARVIVVANLMAMLVQYLSAKTGVATGQDLPGLCREHLPPAVSAGLWVQAELVAMATDLAEFIGAAVGLNLIFGVALLPAGLITAVVAFGILALEQRGYRRFELAIAGLLGIVFAGFVVDLATVGVDPGELAAGLVPHSPGHGAVLLIAGIVGATVMPHVVYLHSALTKSRVDVRSDDERRELLRFQRLDVVVALGAAGLINLAMLFVAAGVFRHAAPGGADKALDDHRVLIPLVLQDQRVLCRLDELGDALPSRHTKAAPESGVSEQTDQRVLARAQKVLSKEQYTSFDEFLTGQRQMQVMGMKMGAKMFGK